MELPTVEIETAIHSRFVITESSVDWYSNNSKENINVLPKRENTNAFNGCLEEKNV